MLKREYQWVRWMRRASFPEYNQQGKDRGSCPPTPEQNFIIRNEGLVLERRVTPGDVSDVA